MKQTLAKLLLSKNSIHKVDGLFGMPELKIIKLDSNSLTPLPDLRKISSTLVELSLLDNSCAEVGSFENVANLEELHVAGGNMLEFPDLT